MIETTAHPVDVRILGTAPGATRLLLAADDRRAAVERAATGDAMQVEVIDVNSGAVERTVPGWALGAPGADGSLTYVEPAGDARWQVRTTADAGRVAPLVVPDGRWRIETALAAGEARVIVFAGDSSRAIISLGPNLAQQASASAEAAPRDAGPSAALSLDGTRLYVLSGANGVFRLTALATGTLAPVWTTELEPPPRESGETSSARAEPPAIKVDVPPWGDRPGFLVQPSGDGSRVLVVHGDALHGAITEPLSLIVVDARAGRVVSSRRLHPEGPFMGHVRSAAPVPGAPQVVLLHVTRFREGGAETPRARFDGVSRFDLATTGEPDVYAVSKDALGQAKFDEMKAVVPSAIAVTRAGTVLLAR